MVVQLSVVVIKPVRTFSTHKLLHDFYMFPAFLFLLLINLFLRNVDVI